MAATFASLGLGDLSIDEKLDVVGQLWDDLITSSPSGVLLTEVQREELRESSLDW